MTIDGVSVIERLNSKGIELKPCKDKEGNVYIPFAMYNPGGVGEYGEYKVYYFLIPKDLDVVEVNE